MYRSHFIIVSSLALALSAPASSQLCGSGPCYEAHAAPGCDVTECCTAVCEFIPSCCQVEWDSLCVDVANNVCLSIGVCGLATAGNCFAIHTNPACSDPQCCSAVCAVDPPCCDVQWDSQCVQRALLTCGGAGGCGRTPDSCFVVHPIGGCDDTACCEVICDIDPHCCEQAWDQVCVAAANCFCAGGCNVACPANAVQEIEACGLKKNDPCYNPGTTIQGQSLVPALPMCGKLYVIQPEVGPIDADVDVFVAQLGANGSGLVTVNFTLMCKPQAWAALVPAPPIGGCTPLTQAVAQVASVNTIVGSQQVCVPAGKYWVVVSAGVFPQIGLGPLVPCTDGKYVVTASFTTGCAAPCGDPSKSCFVPHPTPGCGDPSGCCQTVCSVDPFCCEAEWDNACAVSAASACGAPPPANDVCIDAAPIVEGALPFSTIGATTDGPTLPAECEDASASFTNDVWFVYEPSKPGLVTVTTCDEGTSFDSRLAVYSGACGALAFVGCNDDDRSCTIGTFSTVTFAASCDETYFVRVGGKGGGQGVGMLVLDELGSVGCGCAADLNDDQIVNGADIAILLGNWGNPGAGDLTGDGTVNGADISVVLGSWGPC